MVEPAGSTASRLLARALRYRTPVGATTAAACATLAAIWSQIVPDSAATATPVRAFLLTWGHPITWVFLGGAALAWAFRWPRRAGSSLAWAALFSYIAFIGATIL